MDITQDITTLSNQMNKNFQVKSIFILTDIVLDGLIIDLHFRHILGDGMDIIRIEAFTDNVRDENEVPIALMNFNISQGLLKRPLVEFCKLSLETLLEYLKTVKFDTLLGRFVPPNPVGNLQTSPVRIATRNIFQSIGISVVDNSGECSVCYEKTYCKPSCGHFLCFICC